MLTYEEEDNKWDNWDGGYWGKDTYSEKKTQGSSSCCKIGCFFCCVICLVTLPIVFLVTNGKFICDLPYIAKSEFCLDHVGVNSNSSNVNNNTLFNNTLNNTINYTLTNTTFNYTNSSLQSSSISPNNDLPSNNIDSISLNNQTLSTNNGNISISNLSNSLLYQTQIRENIEETSKKTMDSGEALAISIGSVAGFILFTAGSVYMVRNGHKNIKNYCTNRTASRHNEVKLTEEELKFYEVRNPIQEALERNEGGFFQKGVKLIKMAIEKDRARDFKEAIDLYNKGIDILLRSLKMDANPSDRFVIAKKIDIYVQRVNYINNCIENEKLVADIKGNLKSK